MGATDGALGLQDQVDEPLGWFVRTALPDAEPGWEDLPWRIDEMDRTEGRATDDSVETVIRFKLPAELAGRLANAKLVVTGTGLRP